MKLEIRRPKTERSRKSQGRSRASGITFEPRTSADHANFSFRKPFSSSLPAFVPVDNSDFGLRPSFGFRTSDFEFRSPGSPGFSLIEIMVTVSLLTFIILGLLLMFNQTQRAFRTGMTQTDVLEAGRATMDMLS